MLNSKSRTIEWNTSCCLHVTNWSDEYFKLHPLCNISYQLRKFRYDWQICTCNMNIFVGQNSRWIVLYVYTKIAFDIARKNKFCTRKHSTRMRTDRAVTRSSSQQVAMRPIVDRQTRVKTLPSPWGSLRRQHSSKMRTARLSAIRVSMATTRCQYHGGRYPYPLCIPIPHWHN